MMQTVIAVLYVDLKQAVLHSMTDANVRSVDFKTERIKMQTIAEKIKQLFDLRPGAIEQTLKLRQPVYEETASYGHVGRTPQIVEKTFTDGNGKQFEKTVELFTWEKLNKVEEIKRAFQL